MTKAVITKVANYNFLFIYENEILVECHPLQMEQSLQVGNIYLGRVEKVVKNIQSAFIRLDEEHVGYLPLNDKPAFITNRTLPKGLTSISQNDYVLVQVETEPQKQKQAKVTGNISLAGNYVALDMMNGFVGVSKKIKETNQIKRLKELAKDISYGVVLRTACKDAPNEAILEELNSFSSQLDSIIQRAQFEKKIGLLCAGQVPVIALLEEYGISRIDEIKTDLPDIYDQICKQHLDCNVIYYQEEYALSKLLGLETKLSHITNKHVWLKSGGFLVIEPTEAMVVIDVNTGKSIGKKNMEQHILQTNIEAAGEIARQLRLRNLSGIIMIDFINMQTQEFKEQLINTLKHEIKKDKIQTHFVEVTKLDLYELTRKKYRKPLHEIIGHSLIQK